MMILSSLLLCYPHDIFSPRYINVSSYTVSHLSFCCDILNISCASLALSLRHISLLVPFSLSLSLATSWLLFSWIFTIIVAWLSANYLTSSLLLLAHILHLTVTGITSTQLLTNWRLFANLNSWADWLGGSLGLLIYCSDRAWPIFIKPAAHDCWNVCMGRIVRPKREIIFSDFNQGEVFVIP